MAKLMFNMNTKQKDEPDSTGKKATEEEGRSEMATTAAEESCSQNKRTGVEEIFSKFPGFAMDSKNEELKDDPEQLFKGLNLINTENEEETKPLQRTETSGGVYEGEEELPTVII